ncbi:hypothetical protein N7451_008893 [Penicillium sp. IBT 35674x]|nr:hypothetical protein N7451_008893 [Penicillium sp. IBT 35674x]
MRLSSPMPLVMPMAVLGISTIHVAAATCSDGLVNVVFNTGHAGYTKQRWEKIHSASNWLTLDFGLEDKQIPMLGNDINLFSRLLTRLMAQIRQISCSHSTSPTIVMARSREKSYCNLKKPPILLNHYCTNAETIKVHCTRSGLQKAQLAF